MVMPTMPNWGQLDQASQKIEERGERVNFGQITFSVSYLHWPGSKEYPMPPVDVQESAWNTLPDKQRGMRFHVALNVREFGADFDYTRRIDMGGADWFKIFKPAIEALPGYGKGAMGKGKYGTTLSTIHGKYVEVHGVPQTKTSSDGKTYDVPVIVKIFNSREECLAAKQARFPTDGSTPVVASAPAGVPGIPPGWTPQGWASVIPTIKTALTAGQPVETIAAGYTVDKSFIEGLK